MVGADELRAFQRFVRYGWYEMVLYHEVATVGVVNKASNSEFQGLQGVFHRFFHFFEVLKGRRGLKLRDAFRFDQRSPSVTRSEAAMMAGGELWKEMVRLMGVSGSLRKSKNSPQVM